MKKERVFRKKFKTLRELFNYFIWNPDCDTGEVLIHYIDRPKGVSTLKGSDIKEVGHKFLYLEDGTPIPLHRVLRVYYKGELWWRKR
jgi:hypothetical protein